MKKTAFTIAIAAMAALLAVGCQKENDKAEPQAIVQPQAYPTGNISYTVGKVTNTRTVGDAGEWHTLLAECLDGAEEGHLVTIAHQGGGDPTKERLTYVTESREAALAWVDSRFNEGYDVTLWYDSENGQYICVASKSLPPQMDSLYRFEQQPLGEYLIGTWNRCTNLQTSFSPGAGYVSLDPHYGIYAMTPEQMYQLYKIVPATNTITPSTWQVFTTDSMHIDDVTHKYAIISPYRISMLYPDFYGNYGSYDSKLLYEWSQDTMLVFNHWTIDMGYPLPLIYVRTI